METKDVVISQEYLDKIRRFTAIRPDETFEYVPAAYKEIPDELRATFTLRPISGEEGLRFSDSMHGEVTVENGKALVKTRRGEFTINVVRQGLTAWRNYRDDHGRLVEYKPEAFSSMPVALLNELSGAILERGKLSEEEVLGLR